MNKGECYDKLIALGVDKPMTVALCNWFSSADLTEFIEFLEEEGI